MGTGLAQSITGMGFKPDVVDIKTTATGSHRLFNSTTGTGIYYFWNSSNARTIDAQSVVSYDADGFSIGTSSVINTVATTYRYFAWKKYPGFLDVVQYTGNGTSQTINHSLGTTPGIMFIKVIDISQQSRLFNGFDGATAGYTWNSTSVSYTSSSTYFNNTDPTSTQFTVGSSLQTNSSGNTYIALLFASKPGVSKIGAYTGNGSTKNVTGLGFNPSAVIIFPDATGGEMTMHGSAGYLRLNNTTAEAAAIVTLGTDQFSASSSSIINTNGQIYNYMAFK